MDISIEKAVNGYIITVPRCKKDGNEGWMPPAKYAVGDLKEALRIIARALKEMPTPEDEFDFSFDEAIKEIE